MFNKKDTHNSKTKDFINKSKIVHGEKYSYEKTEYKKAIELVIITCLEHGDFKKTPNKHLGGAGCKLCAFKQSSVNRKSNTKEFVVKAKQIHGDRYSYNKTEYGKNNLELVIITCSKHGDFKKKPSKHLAGEGCQLCGAEDYASKRRFNTKQFVDKAKQVHGDQYSYNKTKYGKNNLEPVIITCSKHGDFPQIPSNHLKGAGCRKCTDELSVIYRSSNTEAFIIKAKIVHGDLYSYEKTKYVKARQKVIITCLKHGDFPQTPDNHHRGAGCRKCADILNAQNQTSNTAEFIDKAKQIHGDRYSYDKTEYTNAREALIVICPKHGDFPQVAFEHLDGSGCPSCNSSKGEMLIAKLFTTMEITFVPQKKFADCIGLSKVRPRKLPFDFYLPDFNTAVEYDGEQHFRPVSIFGGEDGFIKLQMHDEIKNKYCKEKGIKMIRIPYTMDSDDVLPLLKKELQIM